eukprot:COSAG01_NODE_740_length_13891_cov_35.573013_11_plen_204_part_00
MFKSYAGRGHKLMILIIDNYDSFTYNLVDYVAQQSEKKIEVYRNDAIDIDVLKLKQKAIEKIIISPGPKRPENAGISNTVIQNFGKDIPVLGVCLGHQCMGHVYGAEIIGAKHLMHGKTSEVSHTGHAIFKGVSNPFIATRYHSLVIKEQSLPTCLKVIARANDDEEIMAIAHEEYPIYGLQFHPESICTHEGMQMITNFLNF